MAWFLSVITRPPKWGLQQLRFLKYFYLFGRSYGRSYGRFIWSFIWSYKPGLFMSFRENETEAQRGYISPEATQERSGKARTGTPNCLTLRSLFPPLSHSGVLGWDILSGLASEITSSQQIHNLPSLPQSCYWAVEGKEVGRRWEIQSERKLKKIT